MPLQHYPLSYLDEELAVSVEKNLPYSEPQRKTTKGFLFFVPITFTYSYSFLTNNVKTSASHHN